MCGISAIITPYSYNPLLDPDPHTIRNPEEPKDTLRELAERLVPDPLRSTRSCGDGAGTDTEAGETEDHIHVEYEQRASLVVSPPANGTNGTNNSTNTINNHNCNGNSKPHPRLFTNNPDHSETQPTPYAAQLVRELTHSLQKLSHRGPDGQGVWVSKDARVALGHVRLSIRDLSSTGRQPMHAPEAGVHIVVNGEIYDYEQTRALLEARGYVFTGTSDSELVLFLYLEYGEDFLVHLRGEFSILVYDSVNSKVIAARDRYGIKPLYWTTTPSGRILIAAEIKGFLGIRGWKPEWDVKSLVDCGWLYDTRTVFQGVRKVRPGHALVFALDGSYECKPYWTPAYPDKHARDDRTMEEMVAGFKERLVDAVKCRLRADVPIGIYLSGGIDSSAIAGIATHLIRSQPDVTMGSDQSSAIKCFTIAFDEGEHDESAIARRTAEFLGVDYRTMHASEELLCACFERAVWAVEQPAMDLNFVGKCMLSGFVTAQGYPVVLTGEGADEICAGYSLFLADFLAERDTTSALAIDADEFARQGKRLEKLRNDPVSMSNAFNQRQIEFSGKSKALSAVHNTQYPQIQSAGVWDSHLFAPWTQSFGQGNPILTQIQDLDPATRTKIRERWHPLHTALYLSVKGPMEGLILTSLGDRTEMSGSLESRPSFLDHHFTEYANHLPPSAKITIAPDGSVVEKYVLREATKEFITPELYKRRKHPYSAPVIYTPGSHVHTLITQHVTRENLKMLGFVDIEYALGLIDLAFKPSGTNAFRKVLVLAEYVVLHKAFGMDTATMPSAL